MNRKIEIDLVPNEEIVEPYELEFKNILQAQIQLPTGEVIIDSSYRVILTLSKEAMIGMAINLLRTAYDETFDNDPRKVRFWELYPSEKDFLSLSDLGTYLHPKSCQFLLGEGDFGTILEVLEKESDSDL